MGLFGERERTVSPNGCHSVLAQPGCGPWILVGPGICGNACRLFRPAGSGIFSRRPVPGLSHSPRLWPYAGSCAGGTGAGREGSLACRDRHRSYHCRHFHSVVVGTFPADSCSTFSLPPGWRCPLCRTHRDGNHHVFLDRQGRCGSRPALPVYVHDQRRHCHRPCSLHCIQVRDDSGTTGMAIERLAYRDCKLAGVHCLWLGIDGLLSFSGQLCSPSTRSRHSIWCPLGSLSSQRAIRAGPATRVHPYCVGADLYRFVPLAANTGVLSYWARTGGNQISRGCREWRQD